MALSGQVALWQTPFSCSVVYVVVVTMVATISADARNSRALPDIIEEKLDSPGYNSRSRPGTDEGKPLQVFININVNDISSISEQKMEYSMTLYLRQIWWDIRLAYDDFNHLNRSITLNHNQFERIWTPDVFIRNLKGGVFHTITVPNRLIRLSPDGKILYSQRLTLTLSCDMVLNKYPMDNQTCKIEFGSYAYTTDDLELLWRIDAKPVEVNPSISLPEYTLEDVSNIVCTKNFSSTGTFPCLRAYFHLTRRLRAYLLSTYLPSLLVVLLSWVSFWIDLESVPARICLAILTILTITTQSSGLNRDMPSVSFTKALDVWMATCLVFVFSAFIEYSIVNVLARRNKARTAASHYGNNIQVQSNSISDNGVSSKAKVETEVVLKQRDCVCCPAKKSARSPALMVDIVSRILFPVMFLIFNLVYWPWYLF